MITESNIKSRLLNWYAEKGRHFPWRESTDPFVILVTEVLLRKTVAKTVRRSWSDFVSRYPNAKALAEASVIELQSHFAGLGLHMQRAYQLKSLGGALLANHEGAVPCRREDLLSLPGIGQYAASAVLVFACGYPEAVVDVNVARIMVRVFGIRPSRYEARRSPEVWDAARRVVGNDPATAKAVNWAILDLGALVCKSLRPLHEECPLKDVCLFVGSGQEH